MGYLPTNKACESRSQLVYGLFRILADSAHAKDTRDGFVVEIHLRPHIVLIRAFLVQDLPEQVTELVRGVEENFVAMLLGEREPEAGLDLAGIEALWRSPGSRAYCFSACAGS
jgi:hypothetical protein